MLVLMVILWFLVTWPFEACSLFVSYVYTILTIIAFIRSVLKLNEWLIEEDVILKGMRRNGMLSWRPNLEKGCMERSDLQAWAKDKPEGSHRLKSSWLAPRYSWMQASGRPIDPDWRHMHMAKKLSDMEEAEFCAEEEDMIQLNSFPDEKFKANEGPDLGTFELEDADWGDDMEDPQYLEQVALVEAIKLQITPAKQQLLMQIHAGMSSQGPVRDLEVMKKTATMNKRVRVNTQALVKAHEGKFKDALKCGSVLEAIQTLTLKVGPQGKSKKKKGKGKYMKADPEQKYTPAPAGLH